MSDFEDAQARQEVEQLHQLAMDANAEGQYATMERLLEQAVATAQRLDDLPLLVKERLWLADAQRMQGKYTQALATYTWLIGLASDPARSGQVADEDSLWYLAYGFMMFVACGLFLPEMPVERLLRVVADGLQWLERVGKPGWAAGLRHLRGMLLSNQGVLARAREELETALALERRHPEAPGYTLATYQLRLADLLSMEAIGAYAEAVALAEEVLAAAGSDSYDRHWAYKTLAYARLDLDEHEAALKAAHECLLLAKAMESVGAIYLAYEVLGRVYREAGQMTEAATAVVQGWRWARRDGSVQYRNNALANCARVRLLQGRAACGLPATWETLPEQLPAEADRVLAARRVQSARRLVGWARPLAEKLDRASGTRSDQETLDRLIEEAEELEALLGKERSA